MPPGHGKMEGSDIPRLRLLRMNVPIDNPILDIRSYSFRVGRKEILREVSFSVRRGEYLSIVGPNGAGKTTLLKCLDRIYTGGTGAISIAGRPLERYSQRELARRLSYVPQIDGRVFPFSVEQFVLMGRYPYLSPFTSVGHTDREAVAAALERTGVAEFADRRLDTLSGGERQKVYIAAALAQGAEVLLLDEPTTFLDYRHQGEVRDLLARLNQDCKATIVAVTHDLNRAVLDSHRIVALREGAVVFCGPSRDVMRPEILQEIYGTTFMLMRHPQADLPIVVPQCPAEGSS